MGIFIKIFAVKPTLKQIQEVYIGINESIHSFFSFLKWFLIILEHIGKLNFVCELHTNYCVSMT